MKFKSQNEQSKDYISSLFRYHLVENESDSCSGKLLGGLTLNGPLFVHLHRGTVHFYHKYLVLGFDRIQRLLDETQNHSTAEVSPFLLFRHYETFPLFSAL